MKKYAVLSWDLSSRAAGFCRFIVSPEEDSITFDATDCFDLLEHAANNGYPTRKKDTELWPLSKSLSKIIAMKIREAQNYPIIIACEAPIYSGTQAAQQILLTQTLLQTAHDHGVSVIFAPVVGLKKFIKEISQTDSTVKSKGDVKRAYQRLFDNWGFSNTSFLPSPRVISNDDKRDAYFMGLLVSVLSQEYMLQRYLGKVCLGKPSGNDASTYTQSPLLSIFNSRYNFIKNTKQWNLFEENSNHYFSY